jgi:hypothetical protein
MLQSFLIGLREALQCTFLLMLLAGYPGVMPRFRWLAGGVLLAFIAGYPLSYIPSFATNLPAAETWNLLRYTADIMAFYLGVVFLALGWKGTQEDRPWPSPALLLIGFWLFFFEAQAAGFITHDIGIMEESQLKVSGLFVLGTVLGFIPVAFAGIVSAKVPFHKSLTLPGLFVALGAFRFISGGLGEYDDGSVFLSLQRGFQFFMENAVQHLQHMFMLHQHSFLDVPLDGLAAYFSGDRISTAFMLIFIMLPPLLVLIDLYSAPDPVLRDIKTAAQRRLKAAFFRTDLVYKSIPSFAAFLVILVSFHAVNVNMNPMYEPAPFPVRPADGEEGVLRIPLADQLGEFPDGKMRKYVYYYGDRKIRFLAVMKPDGTLGVALDECEICKPSEWNTSALGYAQRGATLVCKYCMTPVPTNTVNRPGGCNPIPLAFRAEDEHIVIELEELIRTYNELQKVEKRGSHL